MRYSVKNVRWLVNSEGNVTPFTINKKGDKIKNVLTHKIIKLKDVIESDIVDQLDARDYNKYNEVFSAKNSNVLTKTLGYNSKVLHTEVAIFNCFSGLKHFDPEAILDSKVDEKELKEITKRINTVYARYEKQSLEK